MRPHYLKKEQCSYFMLLKTIHILRSGRYHGFRMCVVFGHSQAKPTPMPTPFHFHSNTFLFFYFFIFFFLLMEHSNAGGLYTAACVRRSLLFYLQAHEPGFFTLQFVSLLGQQKTSNDCYPARRAVLYKPSMYRFCIQVWKTWRIG